MFKYNDIVDDDILLVRRFQLIYRQVVSSEAEELQDVIKEHFDLIDACANRPQ
jgi:DNA-binding GntR family transcriptional regulator